MLYIQGKFTKNFFRRMLNVAVFIGGTRFVLWDDIVSVEKRRRTLRSKLQRYSIGQDEFEIVTRSGQNESCMQSAECYVLSKESIDALVDRINIVLFPFRDVSIYDATSGRWIVGMVFHEEMVLVRGKDRVMESLDVMGIDYSQKAPSWW